VFDPILTAGRIRTYLSEVADLLPDDSAQCIVVVGGSLLALLGFREGTDDVDSVKRLTVSLQEAVAEVARRHDLAPKWLNDAAVGFYPQTLNEDECTVELDHPRLRVLGVPLRDIFVMKLFASRAVDLEDLSAIWPECGFASPEEAVERYFAAYPHLERDEYLVDDVRVIAARAAAR
jgi:hypothetical protein